MKDKNGPSNKVRFLGIPKKAHFVGSPILVFHVAIIQNTMITPLVREKSKSPLTSDISLFTRRVCFLWVKRKMSEVKGDLYISGLVFVHIPAIPYVALLLALEQVILLIIISIIIIMLLILPMTSVHPYQVINAQLLELQHDAPQVRSQNLWVRLLLQVLLEGALSVEAEALTRLGTTSTTCTLMGGSLGQG
jgi:hypothetical protein